MTSVDDPDLQQALQHERALRRLAAALLRDPADVDDAVQHALAQEACGRRQPGAPLWPFLRSTLQRYASNLRKLTARRVVRERAAAKVEAVPGVDAMLQKEQLRRRVADAVLALDEPYRTTVWLRWFEELATSEVAARLRVPVATVRTRLQRAHAELRRRLDRDYGDRRWAALALPTAAGVGVPVLSGVAVVLAMKKTLVAAAVAMVLVLGYSLLPPTQQAAPLSREPGANPVAAADAGNTSSTATNQREEVAAPAPTAAAPAATTTLRVTHADGSPAAHLQVWFWTDDSTRPDWTRRVDPAQVGPSWPSGMASVYGQPPPPPTGLHTDDHGRVAVPSDPSPVAVTVECVESLWFSAALPDANAALVLPALAPIEATLQGGPPGGRWEALLYAAWLDTDGSDNHGPLRENVATGSGPGVIRIELRRFALEVGQNLRAQTIAGHRCAVDAWGRGFELDSSPALTAAPGAVGFRFLRSLPRLLVTVAEPDGAPTTAPGRVLVTDANSQWDEPLVGGVATFDVNELAPGVHAIAALMTDGGWIRGEVDCPPGQTQYQARLQRGSGTAPLRVLLPELPAAADLVAVLIEDAKHRFRAAEPFDHCFLDAELPPVFAIVDRELLLNMLPAGWLQGLVVTSDCRVGRFAAANAGDTIAGSWLESAPATTIDVGALYRELGDRPVMQAVLEMLLVDRAGAEAWRPILHHLRYPYQEDRTPPPIWRELRLPVASRWRLQASGGKTFSDLTLLRELLLPNR